MLIGNRYDGRWAGPHRVSVYEVEPYRSAWLVRRRGSLHELLCTSRGEAIARAEALRAADAAAFVVLREADS